LALRNSLPAHPYSAPTIPAKRPPTSLKPGYSSTQSPRIKKGYQLFALKFRSNSRSNRLANRSVLSSKPNPRILFPLHKPRSRQKKRVQHTPNRQPECSERIASPTSGHCIEAPLAGKSSVVRARALKVYLYEDFESFDLFADAIHDLT